MTGNQKDEIAQVGARLLDDAYITWFTAETECEQTLRAWFEGPPAERSASYLVYRAALDREEAAAHDLQRLSELAEPCECILAGREQGGSW